MQSGRADGHRKIGATLRADGYRVNDKTVLAVMRDLGVMPLAARAAYRKAAARARRTPDPADLVQRRFNDTIRPGTVLVGDITYVATDEGWPGWVGAELMAQTVAAWGGLQRLKSGQQVQLGFFLGARRYESAVPHFPLGAKLEIHGTMELVSEQGLAVFNCAIFMNGAAEPVATASLNVFQPSNVEAYLKEAVS